MEINVASEVELDQAARLLLKTFADRKVFAFHGDLGAGKTTFIKVVCSILGVESPMSSPTFSIVNEYHSSQGETLFHFDFYRLNSEAEAEQAGLAEYFHTNNYCFVEWPNKAPGILPDDTVHVEITVEGNSRRIKAA